MSSRNLLSHLVATAAAVPLVLFAAAEARAVDPGSQLIGCDQADERVQLEESSHLDPSCTWTRGIEILASNVTLDCQGAHIAAPDRRYGILITAPIDVALSNITVRNCHVEGFLNNIHIEREGFRELEQGHEYDVTYSNILIEDSTSLNSRGVGIFVNAFVTGVTLRNLHVEGAGSTGIYLEAGSKDNVVENSDIVNNGYNENGPNGQFFDFLGGLNVWFWGTGREGLAIDGARFNRVTGNTFYGNSAGGIFLYKNCGEFVTQRPERWWQRNYGADGNVIEGNTFIGEDNGVWIGSRMGENTLPMECSDPAYLSTSGRTIVLDYADDNEVRGNIFQNVGYGIRVEDDGSIIESNEFTGDDPAQQAILVGTRWRTSELNQPVADTTISGNRAQIAGNVNPYRWIHGHENTTYAENESLGRLVGLCEGVQPRMNQFIFVVAYRIGVDPENPPTGGPPAIPPPPVLPPCPNACAATAPVAKAKISIGGLHTPAGDETIAFTGEMVLPTPVDPSVDPVAVGVGLVLADADGTRLLDVQIPGGTYDAQSGAGWRAYPGSGTWTYKNRSDTAPGGITDIKIKDLSRRQPGLVQFSVKGRRGTYPVDPTKLPLSSLFIVDPPTAETGQCGQASFLSASTRCTASRKSVKCK